MNYYRQVFNQLRRFHQKVYRILFTLVLLFGILPTCMGQVSQGFSTRSLVYEPPRILVGQDVRFPQLRQSQGIFYLFYQRILSQDEESLIIAEVITSDNNGQSWSSPQQIGQPIRYSGFNPPPVFSVAENSADNLMIAIAEDATTISLYSIPNLRKISEISSQQTIVSPRLFSLGDQEYMLFATQNVGGRLTLLSTKSLNGIEWENLTVFSETEDILFSFNPVLLYSESSQRIIVLFQGLKLSESPFYQIFSRYSDTRGNDWSETIRVTTEADPFEEINPNSYDNQRPDIKEIDGHIYLVWERRAVGRNSQIYFSQIGAEGLFIGEMEQVTNHAQGAGFPQLLSVQNTPLIFYYDNPLGNSTIFLASKEGRNWNSRNLSSVPGASTFTTWAQTESGVHLIWQNKASPNSSEARIYYREPDQSAPVPRLIPINYTLGMRSNSEIVRIQIQPRADVSGITHFSFSWGKSGDDEFRKLDEMLDTYPLGDGILNLTASEDGPWNLSVRVRDGIGNWSEKTQISYYRDRTAPGPVVIKYPQLDESGYLSSNSFVLEWEPNPAVDLAGYAVTFRYVGSQSSRVPSDVPPLPVSFGKTIQSGTTIERRNIDNGLWALSVSAVDQVGNVGEPSTLFLRLNKYIPVTILRTASLTQDILGNFNLRLQGRGFDANGVINRIILDQDGERPWDYEFSIEAQDYRIVNDTTIEDINISQVITGDYQVILNHSERGEYRSRNQVSLKDAGTILFGDYTLYTPFAELKPPGGVLALTSRDAIFWLTLLFLLATTTITLLRLRSIIIESQSLRLEAQAILLGKPRIISSEKERLWRMKKKGISLRVKFSALIIILVFSVVALIALPLRSFVLTNQQRTLAEGLEQRVQVLIESIASGAANLLPTASSNTIELSNLILQSTVMDEAEFVTITGPNNLVWASNDPYLLGQTVPPESSPHDPNGGYFQRILSGEEYLPGQYEMEDQLTNRIEAIQQTINDKARTELGALPAELDRLGDEIRSLVLSTSTEAINRRTEIDSIRRGLSQRIDSILKEIGGSVQSIPEFSPENYNPQQQYYLFYKPVIYRSSGQTIDLAEYYQGMVRMGVSTANINSRILETQGLIQQNILIFSIVALVAGIVGAALLSFITINPIKKLVAGVELIRDTEDKAELKDFGIKIGSRDELNTLAVVIQQMAQGLAKAAETNKELLFGKDVQKMFIQLDTGPNNNKLSTGRTTSKFSDFFGYYEGAKGVSGDYYYYQKITQDIFAIIKCDISGKGISAALIMVEVATLFLNYFSDWEKKQYKIKKSGGSKESLSELVYNINDLVAERQFVGRFAALNIVLFNERSGEITYCNAGDNQIFVYRRNLGEVIQSTLFASPAAGVFNSKDIPVQFKEEYDKLQSGDELMLFTDGLEEAKRHFRNPDGSIKTVTQKDIDDGKLSDEIIPNTTSEEFGLIRLKSLINTVKQRGIFRLSKYFSPYDPGDLVFDFREIDDTTENTVLSIIAVEKMFRIIPDPSAGPLDRVSIDKKVDDFLRQYFNGYPTYFKYQLPEEEGSLYRVYTHLKEDEQYDDLTILTVKKI